jgi:hypothetical protein
MILIVGWQDISLQCRGGRLSARLCKARWGTQPCAPTKGFGILKEQMGMRRFLLCGLTNVKAELLMAVTAFNLRTIWRFWRKRKLIWQVFDESKVVGEETTIHFGYCA